MIEIFFQEIDKLWQPSGKEPITLSLFGSTALFVQHDYLRPTKDSDILEVEPEDAATNDKLKELAGKDTVFARRHRMYLDIVGRGLPFLPSKPIYHDLKALNAKLRHFRIQVMATTDVVISKLRRFSSSDVADIRAMAKLGAIDHTRLIAGFRSAMERWELGSHADELPGYIENLHVVERDFLFVKETEIELPNWLG
jgi:hypothetical protein